MSVSTALLQLFDPFDGLDPEQLQHMADIAKTEKSPKGTFLTKRGKDIGTVSFLVSGHVDLVDGNFQSESVVSDDHRRHFPLVSTSPSPVSAMAKSDVELILIDIDSYNLARTWKEDGELNLPKATTEESEESGDWMMCLLDSPLFSQIPPTQIQKLFSCFEAVEVDEGDRIVREGEPGEYFYVLESGSASVHNRVSGEIATLKAGNFFGEEALVGETLRNASITMQTPGVVMRLSKQDFTSLLVSPLIRYINGDQLHEQFDQGMPLRLIDIRLPAEFRKLHVKGSRNIPLASMRGKLPELDQRAIYVVGDDGGKRSEVAAHLLCQAGFTTYILQNAYEQYPLEKLA